MKKAILLFFVITTVAAGYAQGSIPRPEYPRPQFEREAWVNLNGTWTFSFDHGKSGKERRFQTCEKFEDRIVVPFCVESQLSGIEYKDFMESVWYQRSITIPSEWSGKQVFINFGAVDYACELFLDGRLVGRHSGGSSPFSFNLTKLVEAGKTCNLVLNVTDNLRGGKQTGGKQHSRYYSSGPSYSRVTGIWQTVWLEAVDTYGLRDMQIIPDLDQQQVSFRPEFLTQSDDHNIRVTVKDGGKTVGTKIVKASNSAVITIPVPKVKAWSPESPFLYDVVFEVLDSNKKVVDKVNSYVGIRKISIDGQRLMLNNKPYFQRLVLDQGFYPEGLWTAPSDEALKKDIELSKAAGFNGARLHQKVFEPRFHYWADKLGYITWGEAASWGMSYNDAEAQRNFLSEWTEVIRRDRNVTSIVAWTPMNEVWGGIDYAMFGRFMGDLYRLTKGLDPTRLFIGSSGGTNFEGATDVFTAHNYEGDGARLAEQLIPRDGIYYFNRPSGYREREGLQQNFLMYDGKTPYCLDEIGGVKWVKGQEGGESSEGWGYGGNPESFEAFYERVEGIVDAVLQTPYIWGYCYTQLTDIEQEQNGIYYYDRSPKFDMERINKIFSKTRTE